MIFLLARQNTKKQQSKIYTCKNFDVRYLPRLGHSASKTKINYHKSFNARIKHEICSVCAVLIFGVLVMTTSFVAQFFGDLVLTATLSMIGSFGGPVLSVISLGIFLPFVNSWVGCI